MKEKEGAGVRREVWIHPEGRRKRLHITTSAAQDQRAGPDSEDEELATLSSVEVTSFAPNFDYILVITMTSKSFFSSV